MDIQETSHCGNNGFNMLGYIALAAIQQCYQEISAKEIIRELIKKIETIRSEYDL